MATFTPDQLLEITRAALKSAEFCFLMTLDETGEIKARLMQPYEAEPDLTIWFGTSPTSRKVRDIQNNSRVTLGYAYAQEGAYVTLAGTAAIDNRQAKRQQYWREAFDAFWPEGPESDDYTLIKVVPDRIELMNIARGIAPAPFGLRAVILVRSGADWVVANSND